MPVSKDCFLTRDSLDAEMRSRDTIEGELDRLRIRERLEATLAGLGELEYLKQRHELLVRTVLNHGGNAYLAGEENITGMLEENYLNPQAKVLEENILLLRKQLVDAICIKTKLFVRSAYQIDAEMRSRDTIEGELDRLRIRERLEATLAGLGELEYLKQRHELLVRTVLNHGGNAYLAGEENITGMLEENYLNPQAKVLEENILLLRKQLGIYSWPFERRVSVDHVDHADPFLNILSTQASKGDFEGFVIVKQLYKAKGFYELSDGASGSLSNSSNSVFSECLSSCRSSTCFCSPLDTSLSASDGCPKSADNLAGWIDCVEGQCEDQNSATVKRSLSGPYSASLDGMSDIQTKYQCDLISRNGNDIYRYPSPLHAVAVQSPMFFQSLHNSLPKKRIFVANKGLPLSTVAIDLQEVGSPHSVSSPKDNVYQYVAMSEENKALQPVKTVPARKGLKPRPAVPLYLEDRPPLELRSEGSSSQSLDEGGQMVNAQYIPAQKQTVKLRKGGKNIKIVKVRSATLKPRMHTELIPEICPEKPRMVAKKCRFPEEVSNPHKTAKKGTSKAKKGSSFQPEGSLCTRQASSTSKPTARHHGHGRETVVAKPKYKRSDYRRCKTIAEVPYEEVLRRARRRQKKEILGQVSAVYLRPNAQYSSPYAYIGSDSEYSAECASLFHSTVLDTSEDEKSNYTTNCFGDSESSLSEVDFAGESTTSSDTDESGGLAWPQFGNPAAPVAPSEMTSAQAKAFVKIKASHNLKKKILRFRTGSLKLMTTV
ncbi:UNVERIFIED_CONTAM: hypothetical protein FKN15_015904 [Acipenser sinensis]